MLTLKYFTLRAIYLNYCVQIRFQLQLWIDVVLFTYNLLFGIFTDQCSLICTTKTKQTNNYTSCFITDGRSEWKVLNCLNFVKLVHQKWSQNRNVRKKYLFTAMKLTAISLYNIIRVWALLVQCNLMSNVSLCCRFNYRKPVDGICIHMGFFL